MKKICIIIAGLLAVTSCNNYLDIIPDNISTLRMAFNNRANAIKYLSTCYNYMMNTFDISHNSGMMGADDVTFYIPIHSPYWDFSAAWTYVTGGQNTTRPSYNYWNGPYNKFRGVNECNIFLANIDRVPDMTLAEKNRWKAEVCTLKAYYLYWIFLHYGPIPLMKENVDIGAEHDRLMLPREKIDDVVDYIVSLLDEAIYMDPGLPEYIVDRTNESGRITRAAAMGIKAKVLVVAASPLFNGNEDYAGFLDPRDNQPFFDQTKSTEKWEKAAAACKEAIVEAEKRYKLFEFTDNVQFALDDDTRLHMTLRETLNYRYNSEQIFAPGSSPSDASRTCQPRLTTFHVTNESFWSRSQFSPTLNVVEEYYTDHGVPLEEDNSVVMSEIYDLVSTPDDKPAFFAPGERTIRMHLNREPRFYAHIGFDMGKWFSIECVEFDRSFTVNSRNGGTGGQAQQYTSITGYFCKKLCSYLTQNTSQTRNFVYVFPNLHLRLADLYLLYSEALNETMATPSDEVYEYIQRVRHRAGLDKGTTLQQTWALYSKNPNKPLSQEGMRQIIRRERLIELQFEGFRLHDIRRWKEGLKYFDTEIEGLSVFESEPERFYVPTVVYQRSFSKKDYLWPLAQDDLLKNSKLVQNPWWN